MQLRGLGLALERAQARARLALDVEHTRDVVLGALELELGAAAALAVLAQPGRLLDQEAAVARLGVDDPLDPALRDDGVHLLPEAGVGEDLQDVDEPAAGAVQPILAVTRAIEAADDRELGELAVEDPVRVVDDDLHLRRGTRGHAVAAGEDHVLHGLPAHGQRALLAQRPQHGVGDVRLARAVGPDDDRHARGELQLRAIRERLEALERDRAQVHQEAFPGSGGHSSSTRSSACEAASCSAAFLVLPAPWPISSPDTSATATKSRSCAGPVATTIR